MEIYAVKVLDISEKELHDVCLLIDKEKKGRIEKFINRKDKIRTLISEILLRTIIMEKFNINNNYTIIEKNQ